MTTHRHSAAPEKTFRAVAMSPSFADVRRRAEDAEAARAVAAVAAEAAREDLQANPKDSAAETAFRKAEAELNRLDYAAKEAQARLLDPRNGLQLTDC